MRVTVTAFATAGSRLLRGDVATAVPASSGHRGRELQVHGSGMLVQTLLRHDLGEEYRLVTVQIVLGAGKPAVGAIGPEYGPA